MALTSSQRDRIRRLIGDTGSTQVFTDTELDTIYSDVGEDLMSAVVECLDVLAADAAKRVTYRQGQSFQDDNKLFEHLEWLRAKYAKRAKSGKGRIGTIPLKFNFYSGGDADDDGVDDGADIPPDDDLDEWDWLVG